MIKKYFYPVLALIIFNSHDILANENPDPWYQVEIIVFEIKTQDSEIDDNEIWPDDPGLPNFDDALNLEPANQSFVNSSVKPIGPNSNAENGLNSAELPIIETQPNEEIIPGDAPLPYQQVAPNQFQLSDVKKRLYRSKKFDPILHMAWKQPVNKSKPQAVIISSDDFKNIPLFDQADQIDFQTDNTAYPVTDKATDRQLDISGTIKLIKKRYLHLSIDLLFNNAADTLIDEPPVILNELNRLPSVFRMRQKRRVRTEELHYFDHPKFGLFATITPFSINDEDIEGATPIPLNELSDN